MSDTLSTEPMLVDTDVLIWHLRGYPQATRRLDELGALTISAVSYLEVLQGMRNKAELAAVQKMLRHRAATLLPVTEPVTLRAIALMESITLSHGLQMGDALIAATALEYGLPVLTANVKHFGPPEFDIKPPFPALFSRGRQWNQRLRYASRIFL